MKRPKPYHATESLLPLVLNWPVAGLVSRKLPRRSPLLKRLMDLLMP